MSLSASILLYLGFSLLLSQFQPIICRLTPFLLSLFQGLHVACWNLTQKGLSKPIARFPAPNDDDSRVPTI